MEEGDVIGDVVRVLGGTVPFLAHHFQQVALDGLVVHGHAFYAGKSFGLDAFRQKLQCADATLFSVLSVPHWAIDDGQSCPTSPITMRSILNLRGGE